MKLLLDQHLSPRLVNRLADVFPGSSHVSFHALDDAEDKIIWEFAKQNGFALVTKDADFNDLSTLLGFPPKVLWLRIGNCTTEQIEKLLRDHQQSIEHLDEEAGIGILTLQ